jgi:putative aldouronate transport system permease protein
MPVNPRTDHAEGIALLRKNMWSHRTLYLFLLPTIVYLAIFSYAPMYGIIIAFKDYNGAFGILRSRWVGFRHFANFLSGYYFWPIMRNTLTISLYSMVVGFPIAIVLALMLNEIRHQGYRKLVQTILYAPYFISTVVLVGTVIIMFSPSIGIINHFLGLLGLERKYFLIQPRAFSHIYVWTGVWQSAGWSAIIYLSALSSIDPGLHESAVIDGANRLQRIRYINLPTIKPTIVILLILSIGNMIGIGFEKAFLLQNDLNLSNSEVIATYVYRRGLIQGDFSFSTAVGLFNTMLNLLLLIGANTIARRLSDYSLF